MGLLQAVAAAAEVAAAAAPAAVSAASINHLSSPSPVRDEGLPRCPRSPFSPSPPPPQSTARKTLHFRGGAKRARPAGCPSRSGAGHPRRMRSPSPPPTPAQLGLLLWRWRRRVGNPLRNGVVARFSQCLAEFRTWLRTNWLRFNADKTDVMLCLRTVDGPIISRVWMRLKNHVNDIIKIPVCDNLIKWSHWIKLYVKITKRKTRPVLCRTKRLYTCFGVALIKIKPRKR